MQTPVKNKILVYGANGYMGQLFTRYAEKAHLPIVCAARTAPSSSHTWRIFGLDDVKVIAHHLQDIALVVNLAGPFAATQEKWITACLNTRTHYIDIAGEYPEFSNAYRHEESAKSAGIMLMPGAGFGVVPTDIAALLAHQGLPNANQLNLSYITQGGASRGTLHTVLKDIDQPGIAIRNGKTIEAMPASHHRYVDAYDRKHRVVYNPWRADLFTARLTTGIANISTYANYPTLVEHMMHGRYLWLRDFLLRSILRWLPAGPTERQLQRGRTFIQAQTINDSGVEHEVHIQGPEAYVFTAQTLTSICRRILDGQFSAGFQTPSYYGLGILMEYNNVIIHTAKNKN